MSASFTLYLQSALLNHVFNAQLYPMPAGIYVGLFTGMPPSDGSAGGTEIGTPDYVRLSVLFTPPGGSPPQISNPNNIQWNPAAVTWGQIVAGGLFDQLTGGNMLGSAPLVDPTDGVTQMPKSIGQGDVFRIPVNNLIVGFLLPPPSGISAPGFRMMPVLYPIGAEVVAGR